MTNNWQLLRKKLFDTILGRGNTFSKVWLLQYIDFPSIYNECRIQIKQYYNGPCGAVASLQVMTDSLSSSRFRREIRFQREDSIEYHSQFPSSFLTNRNCGISGVTGQALLFGYVGRIPRHLTEKEKLIELRKRGVIGALCTILFLVSELFVRKFPELGGVPQSFLRVFKCKALHVLR